jgi:predicted DNA-binding transcriptional regulator YafY
LQTTPLKTDLETAEAKLLAALPKAAREVLAQGPRIVGIEQRPDDIFHGRRPAERLHDHQAAVDRFLEGILAQRRVEITHRNPYRDAERMHEIEPHGLLWDRDLWYLVGRSLEANEVRMWRADRVLSIKVTGMAFRSASDFDIREMLGRQWLERAMRSWDTEKEGSRIRISAEAARRLRGDWYYRHAAYLEGDAGWVVMSIPDTDAGSVLPLVRWLGAEAEILEPVSLREKMKSELDAIRLTYA